MKRILFALLLVSANAFAHSPRIEESLLVNDPSKSTLALVKQNKAWIIDHVNKDGYELYGPKGLWSEFDRLPKDSSVRAWPVSQKADADYPSFAQIEAKLKELAASAPTLAKLVSIGKSVQGRDLWMMKLSDNVEADELEPEFKYISSMHGDEITGRQLMMSLIEDLIKGYQAGDKEVMALLDNTEIYIMPSMNPDGSTVPKRGNANGADLNRDFPDFSTDDNKNDPTGRQPETQAVMKFQDTRNFAMSANFHGGAEVVNYAWDTIEDPFPQYDLVVDLSLKYASLVPYIYASSEFPKGITNGFAWYEVDGGMQDWSITWYNDLQFTIELSDVKYPAFSKMSDYYKSNKTALMKFMSLVHQGAGIALAKAEDAASVEVFRVTEKGEVAVGKYMTRLGQFYKVLDPGQYRFHVVTSTEAFDKMMDVKADTIMENGNYALQ